MTHRATPPQSPGTATEQQLDLLRYPKAKVIGIVDTPEDLDQVLRALEEAGIGRDRITVFSGDEGIRTIDPGGTYHGLLGRLTRVVQAFGEERSHLEQYKERLRAGHFIVVVVSMPGEAAKEP